MKVSDVFLPAIKNKNDGWYFYTQKSSNVFGDTMILDSDVREIDIRNFRFGSIQTQIQRNSLVEVKIE